MSTLCKQRPGGKGGDIVAGGASALKVVELLDVALLSASQPQKVEEVEEEVVVVVVVV